MFGNLKFAMNTYFLFKNHYHKFTTKGGTQLDIKKVMLRRDWQNDRNELSIVPIPR
jgi:hypothetical protein